MIYHISTAILWLFFKVCFRYRVRFRENIPRQGPFVIASNHMSFLDPAAVGIITKRQVCFLARDDLFRSRMFAWWAANVGIIPVKRGRFDLSAIRGSLGKLNKGHIVALFPEGTRSKDGSIRNPKAGVGFLAVKAGVPVVPVLVKGSDKALPKDGIFVRFKRVEVSIAKPVWPKMFLDKYGRCDYQAMSTEVMERIRRLGNTQISTD